LIHAVTSFWAAILKLRYRHGESGLLPCLQDRSMSLFGRETRRYKAKIRLKVLMYHHSKRLDSILMGCHIVSRES
jgi:hypothetical protein